MQAFFKSCLGQDVNIPPKPSYDGLLPTYIKPLPCHISEEDAQYLARKGALLVPSLELRDQLLRCYIEFVHGNLPVLDWHDILACIEQRRPSHDGLSLVLFQAIMFAGTAFVDLQYLKEAGFQTRRAARHDFFIKVKVRTLYRRGSNIWLIKYGKASL